MYRIATCFLVCVILMQCTLKTAIVGYCQWNKAYITANLCENKDMPKSCCAGKCYLDKKLKAQQREEDKASIGKSKEEILLFFQLDFIQIQYNSPYDSPFFAQFFLKDYTGPSFDILHPPA